MNNLNDLIRRYTIRHEKKIKRICSPIASFAGIRTFAYYSIDHSGRFFIVSNYPKQLDFFYSNKLYLECPYLAHPSLFHSGCAIIPITKDVQFLHQSRVQHRIDHFFLILERYQNRIEGFFLASDRLTPSNGLELFRYLEIFRKFGKYFKYEARALIQQGWDDGYNLFQAKGNAFLSKDPMRQLSSQDPQVKTLLKDIRFLTLQEEKCLELFKQGHSAQATASMLGISQRTVEHYFENIKDKLACQSKWDLLNW